MIKHSPRKVIIVGNGYLPYLIALTINKNFKRNAPEMLIVDLGNQVRQDLIQSLGSMKSFHSDLGLPEVDFVKSTRAEIHYGFDYSGFSKLNSGAMFCDAQYGFDLQNRRFYHLFNKLRQVQPVEELEDYCLSAKLARVGRFTPPSPNPRSVYASINYGYRLTEEAYAEFLKSRLAAFDTRVVSSPVESVALDSDGFIESISVESIGTLKGDFFIDASESRVVKNALGDGGACQPLYPPDLLLNVASSVGDRSEKQAFSNISLNQQMLELRAGYLDRNYQTTFFMKGHLPRETASPQYFKDGEPWQRNCVAMGYAFTNRAPILIDNGHVNQNMIVRLLDLWPRSAGMNAEARSYNASSRAELEHIVDLDCLHLALAFNRVEILSDNMRYKLDTFAQCGKVAYYEKELLQEQQWPILFNALGIIPDTIDLSVRNCADRWLKEELFRIKSTLAKAAEAAPLYQDFIRAAHR